MYAEIGNYILNNTTEGLDRGKINYQKLQSNLYMRKLATKELNNTFN